jgi:sarcosine oxidase subunit delta
MKIINCPLNGPRNAQEFVYGGEVELEPETDASTRQWSNFVFLEDNLAGIVDEWWCHSASSYWFIIRRNRTSDEIIATITTKDYFSKESPE